jgi:non-heme chloroperoxidase
MTPAKETAMRTLTARDGVSLSYRDEGSGPTLLIVPGWGVSTWWFREQFAGLSDRFRVVSYDPRGQGESENTARGQRVARLAGDLADVMDELQLDDVHLVAWSGGGSTALQYIELHGTGRLASLVLEGAGPRLLKTEDWDLGFVDLQGAVAWVELIRSDFTAAAKTVLPQFFAAELSADEHDAALREMQKCDPEGAARASWDFLTRDYRDLLQLVDVPTLIVAGEQDVAVPAGNAAYIAAAIAGSRTAMVAGAAHCPFLEEPEQFNRLVAEFVRSNGRAQAH